MTLVSVYSTATATHLVGGYMSYEFVREVNGQNQYIITFNVYRDCLNSTVELDPTIEMGIYLNNAGNDIYQRTTFNIVTKDRVDIPGSTDCPVYLNNVCVEFGFYQTTILLPRNLQGYHITFARCCRNEQKNLRQGNSPTQGQTYYCFIPNSDLQNSSPAFYGVPSPYMCVNDTTSMLFDAVDKDGDKLEYRVMQPYAGGSNSDPVPRSPDNLDTPTLVYNPGYNFRQPFGANGFISVDRATGRTLLFAPEIGNYVVGIEVVESRNGTVLSRTRLDLQIIVINCPDNDPPKISSNEGKRFEINAGEEFCFSVTATDPDNDFVQLRARGALLGDGSLTGSLGTFTDASGRPSASGEFCWTPDCDQARDVPYYVYFTAEDDGCPQKSNDLDVEIIVNPFEGTTNLKGPENVCRFNRYVYWIEDGGRGSNYEWEIAEGRVVLNDGDSLVTVLWEGTGTGNVRVREVSAAGCIGEWADLDVTIVESPATPIILGSDTVCSDDVPINYSVVNNPLYTYSWEAENATIGLTDRNEITLTGFGLPAFSLSVVATNDNGCPSDTGRFTVAVVESDPTLAGPETVCPNAQGIAYTANGLSNSTYTWTITGGTQASGGITNSITVNWGDEGIGTITVVESNRFGCTSTPVVLSVNKSYTLDLQNIDGLDDVCEFTDGVAYSVDGAQGSIYRWTVSGGNQVSGDSTSSIAIDWGAAGFGNIRLVQRAFDNVNNRECLSPPLDFTVVIRAKPTADDIEGVMELCQLGDTGVYEINGLANSTYSWTVNGSSDVIGQGSNVIKVFWVDAGTFPITVNEETEFGCSSFQVDTVVLVNPKPTTSAIVGAQTICESNLDNQAYTVDGFPTSTFDWAVGGARNWTGQGTPSVNVNWERSVPRGNLSVVEISDKGCIGDTQEQLILIDRLAIDLRFVSVGTPDDRMLINWQLKEEASSSEFIIEKKVSNTNAWSEVARVSGSTFQYVETGINTDLSSFDYRIAAINACGDRVESEVHTSILLEGSQDEDFNSLVSFSDYLGWLNGVAFYDIYLAANGGNYALELSDASSDLSQTLTHDVSQFRKCFRVRGDELLDENTHSWSNEICFFFAPNVFVPNAFTANRDGLNDGFGVKGVAVNEFSMKIYNRWGEKLYESDDIDEKWIPVYRDVAVPMGTYVYVINFTDFENKIFQKTGTINLIR